MSAAHPAAPFDPDDFVGRAAGRVRALEALTEIAMDVARAIRRKAIAEAELAEAKARQAEDDARSAPLAATPEPGKRNPDPAAALDRIARCVRLTITLATRMDETLRALLAGEPARIEAAREDRERRNSDEAHRVREVHKDRIRDIVMDAAEREIETIDALNDLDDAVRERLDDDPAYCDIETLPLREVVERLCQDVQITPDWSRWSGEGWIPKERFYRPPYATGFHEPSRRPTERWRLALMPYSSSDSS